MKLPHSDGTFSKKTTSLGDYISNHNNKFIVVPTRSIYKLISNISILEDSNFASTENKENIYSKYDRKLTPKEKE